MNVAYFHVAIKSWPMKGREAGKPARKNITETERMKQTRLSPVVSTLLIAVFALTASRVAMATTVYDDFGPFPNADFGGTGIPNDSVAASTQIVDGNVQITLAMSATQRFFNPALTNNDAGTYFAGAGSNFGGPGSTSTLEGALWNFNTYMKIECITACASTPKLTDYQIDFYYDFNPAAAFSLSNMGKIDVTASLGSSTSALEQGSENLLFGYLANDWSVPGTLVSTAPTDTTVFDPNAIGEYQFYIEVNGGGLSAIESVAIEVQVVPIPPAVWLFGSGLIGLVGIARRKNSV
jgi:hypothetical protein